VPSDSRGHHRGGPSDNRLAKGLHREALSVTRGPCTTSADARVRELAERHRCGRRDTAAVDDQRRRVESEACRRLPRSLALRQQGPRVRATERKVALPPSRKPMETALLLPPAARATKSPDRRPLKQRPPSNQLPSILGIATPQFPSAAATSLADVPTWNTMEAFLINEREPWQNAAGWNRGQNGR
jgi:hypothetical protein